MTTNNATERFWIRYISDCCNYKMFKRIDFELNANINCYGDQPACLLDMLVLSERDSLTSRTRIATDVHERLLLAHAIVIRGGVRAGPGTLMFVKKGLSPRSLIQFGSHASRPSRDIRVAAVHAAPISEWIERDCVGSNETVPAGYYCVDIATRECTCFDFMYHGPSRGSCKHCMACVLTLRAPDVEEAAIDSLRDFTTAVRVREVSVRKGDQVPEALSADARSVWEFVCSQAVTVAHSASSGETTSVTETLASLETEDLGVLLEKDAGTDSCKREPLSPCPWHNDQLALKHTNNSASRRRAPRHGEELAEKGAARVEKCWRQATTKVRLEDRGTQPVSPRWYLKDPHIRRQQVLLSLSNRKTPPCARLIDPPPPSSLPASQLTVLFLDSDDSCTKYESPPPPSPA